MGGSHSSPTVRLTERDLQIVALTRLAQALRDDQIRVAFFSEENESGCQRRLTQLVRNKVLDRLPRKSVNEPFVYVLGRGSVEGNRLLRERWGEDEFERQNGKRGPLAHLLAINDVRVRIVRACRDLGWTLKTWQHADELRSRLGEAKLIPDAYFQIQRVVDGQEKTAGFFLELERAGKSRRVLRSKLRRYGELYYGGRYAELFGTRALRVLVVFTAVGGSAERRIAPAQAQAEQLGVKAARFASLEILKGRAPTAVLTENVWFEPANPHPLALFAITPAQPTAEFDNSR